MKIRKFTCILLVFVLLNFMVEVTGQADPVLTEQMVKQAMKDAMKELMDDANFFKQSSTELPDPNNDKPPAQEDNVMITTWKTAIFSTLKQSEMGWVQYVYWGIIAVLLILFVGTLVWACMIKKERTHLEEELERVNKALEILRADKENSMKGQIDTIRAERGLAPIHGTNPQVVTQDEQDAMWMSAFVQNGQQKIPKMPDQFSSVTVPERPVMQQKTTDVIDILDGADDDLFGGNDDDLLAIPSLPKGFLDDDYDEGMFDDDNALFGGMPEDFKQVDDGNDLEKDAASGMMENDDELADFFG